MPVDPQEAIPNKDEDAIAFSRRLEIDGHDEMFIRIALRTHFNFEIGELGQFFEQFGQARLRHIALLTKIHPNRTTYSLEKKVAKNLGISEKQAKYWVAQFQKDRPIGKQRIMTIVRELFN